MGALDLRNGSETVFRARRLDDTAGRIEGGLYTQIGRIQQDRVVGLDHRSVVTARVARVATANTEALANLSWPMRDYRALVEQMQYVRGIPQVPGGYYTWRNINNAFYTITTDTATNNTTPREALPPTAISCFMSCIGLTTPSGSG